MIFQMLPSHTAQHENNFVSWKQSKIVFENVFSLFINLSNNTDKVYQKIINFEISWLTWAEKGLLKVSATDTC